MTYRVKMVDRSGNTGYVHRVNYRTGEFDCTVRRFAPAFSFTMAARFARKLNESHTRFTFVLEEADDDRK